MAQGYDGMQLDDLEVCKILKVMCSRLCFCFILSYVSSLDPEACSAACSLNLGCTRHTYLYVARFQTTESDHTVHTKFYVCSECTISYLSSKFLRVCEAGKFVPGSPLAAWIFGIHQAEVCHLPHA